MPKCQKCGAAMATVLNREGGHVQTYYECPSCEGQGESPEKEPRDTKEDTEDGCMAMRPWRWRAPLRTAGRSSIARGRGLRHRGSGCDWPG